MERYAPVPERHPGCVGLLVVFFVAIVGFLMLFGRAVSVFLNQHHPTSGAVAVPLLAVFCCLAWDRT